jgi:hypothetical protein
LIKNKKVEYLGMSAEEIITYTGYALAVWATIQGGYALTILLLGNVMVEYYEWGTYEKPETLYQKSVNTFFVTFMGIGPFIYKKLLRNNWFVRKLLMVVFLFLYMITSIYVYKFITFILKALFL